MLISRSRALFRLLNKKNVNQNIRNMSGHKYYYRTALRDDEHSKATRILPDVIGGIVWWWILWHLWHEPEHITGEFPYPDVSKWTDEELGIPKD